ncbi:hypothetical protein D3C76_334240 [compost metagenome]
MYFQLLAAETPSPVDVLGQTERVLQFIDKYGITQVGLVLAIAALIWIIRQVFRGKLVPRWMFDQVVADRDRVLSILESEETGALHELMAFMKKLKADDQVQDQSALQEILEEVRHNKASRGGGG